MANPTTRIAAVSQTTTVEAFVTDRQLFWASFTRFATRAVVVVVILVALLAITLV